MNTDARFQSEPRAHPLAMLFFWLICAPAFSIASFYGAFRWIRWVRREPVDRLLLTWGVALTLVLLIQAPRVARAIRAAAKRK